MRQQTWRELCSRLGRHPAKSGRPCAKCTRLREWRRPQHATHVSASSLPGPSTSAPAPVVSLGTSPKPST
eukprot:8262059-Alexandrium_andersonii.AAC.1